MGIILAGLPYSAPEPQSTFTFPVPLADEEGQPITAGDVAVITVVRPHVVSAWAPGWTPLSAHDAWKILDVHDPGSAVTLTAPAPGGWEVRITVARPAARQDGEMAAASNGSGPGHG